MWLRFEMKIKCTVPEYFHFNWIEDYRTDSSSKTNCHARKLGRICQNLGEIRLTFGKSWFVLADVRKKYQTFGEWSVNSAKWFNLHDWSGKKCENLVEPPKWCKNACLLETNDAGWLRCNTRSLRRGPQHNWQAPRQLQWRSNFDRSVLGWIQPDSMRRSDRRCLWIFNDK